MAAKAILVLCAQALFVQVNSLFIFFKIHFAVIHMNLLFLLSTERSLKHRKFLYIFVLAPFFLVCLAQINILLYFL